MKRLLLASAVTTLLAVSPASAATYTGSATSYAACDGSTTMTASGRTVRTGWAANNFLAIGTWIEMVKPSRVQGIKFWKIMDRGGPGFVLDFWSNDCAWMHSFGRRTVTFKAVPPSRLYKGRPVEGWRFVTKRGKARLAWFR